MWKGGISRELRCGKGITRDPHITKHVTCVKISNKKRRFLDLL